LPSTQGRSPESGVKKKGEPGAPKKGTSSRSFLGSCVWGRGGTKRGGAEKKKMGQRQQKRGYLEQRPETGKDLRERATKGGRKKV